MQKKSDEPAHSTASLVASIKYISRFMTIGERNSATKRGQREREEKDDTVVVVFGKKESVENGPESNVATKLDANLVLRAEKLKEYSGKCMETHPRSHRATRTNVLWVTALRCIFPVTG